MVAGHIATNGVDRKSLFCNQALGYFDEIVLFVHFGLLSSQGMDLLDMYKIFVCSLVMYTVKTFANLDVDTHISLLIGLNQSILSQFFVPRALDLFVEEINTDRPQRTYFAIAFAVFTVTRKKNADPLELTGFQN